MFQDRQQLDRRILAFIRTAGAAEPFEQLAADLFAWQYEHNTVYRAYCDECRGPGPLCEPNRPREPSRPRPGPDWRSIPAAWPVAWRMAELRCFDAEDTVATFLSSGTTAAAGEGEPGDAPNHGRGRHCFDTLELYRAALAPPFAEALLPQPGAKPPILVLMPSPGEAFDSSLSFMMGEAIRQFGRAEVSGFFVHDGRYLFEEFAAAIERVGAGGEPAVLASTAFGWVAFLEFLGGRRVPLLVGGGSGSRIMETGGYKGRSDHWPRERLYSRLADAFGLPPSAIVSEYGMCELSSQFYSPSPLGRGPQASAAGPVFHGPPWTRALAIDPESQLAVPPGEPGLLRIIDLANRGSAIAVQTEDLAIITGERSFQLLGRAPSAPPKGCSLTAEELYAAGET